MAHRYLHRKRKGQVRRELGQPLRLLRRLPGGPSDARQSSSQVITEPVDVMIGSVRRDRIDLQIGPLWELRGEQPADERYVGVHLVGVHFTSGNEHIFHY